MKKAFDGLVFYPKMIHVTCLAHAFNRVAEYIRGRGRFTDVNDLISSKKAVFLKAPTRREIFQEMTDNLSLPPAPVITRWNTWLEAAIYYADNFEAVKAVVDSFDPEDAECISKAQTSFGMERIRENLIFVKINFTFIPEMINILQKRGLLLSKAIDLVKCSRERFATLDDEGYLEKFRFVIGRIGRFDKLAKFDSVLRGNGSADRSSTEYTLSELSAFKYAPTTSYEVERIFSSYKTILRDNRRSLLFENLKYHILVKCNLSVSDIEFDTE